jgi:ArsR family transcriptional regulator
VLEILASADEVSVAEMLEQTGLEPSHLSQHLSVLRRYHLVRSERRASVVYYRLEFDEVGELLAVARVLLGRLLDPSASTPLPGTVTPAAETPQDAPRTTTEHAVQP